MEFLNTYFKDKETTIARDLKLNLSKLLSDSSLTKEEALLVLVALSSSAKLRSLEVAAHEELKAFAFTREQLQEASESAALMGMLNTYYKFRHMIGIAESYKSAGLRMTALATPQLGKERFEMLAFAVSVLNGCETCIRSHEAVLLQAQISHDKIHDLARMASVVKGIQALS